jgi:hypothetical protein
MNYYSVGVYCVVFEQDGRINVDRSADWQQYSFEIRFFGNGSNLSKATLKSAFTIIIINIVPAFISKINILIITKLQIWRKVV